MVLNSAGPSQYFQTGTASPSSIVGVGNNNGNLHNSGIYNQDSTKALFYCTLLAFQFGLQPMIASKFTSSQVSKSSIVIATELTKIWIAITVIAMEPISTREKLFSKWSFKDSLKVAALPAVMYAIQNLMVQYAYVLLDSMTFNLLNQTKTLSAALWLFLIMGQRQSLIQIGALLLLLGAAVVLNTGGQAKTIENMADYKLGVLMVMGASTLSGLSTALTQRALVGSAPRHALFFSAELAVYGIVFLIANMYFTHEGTKALKSGILNGWEYRTVIPVISNAFGGVVVGLVTKYAGGVVKGFALIAGIIITGFAQWFLEGKQLRANDWIAVILVSISIYLHTSYPYKANVHSNSSVNILENKNQQKLKKDL